MIFLLITEFAYKLVSPPNNDEAQSSFWTTFRAILLSLTTEAFLPLAEELGFIRQIREAHLYHWHRTNVLSIPGHSPKKKALPVDAPEVSHTFECIYQVISTSQDVTAWKDAFIEQRLFQNPWTAQRAADALFTASRVGAQQAHDLVEAWLTSDDSALLNYSTYPYLTELTLLQTKVHEVAYQNENNIDLSGIIAELRADVVSLIRSLKDRELQKLYQMLVDPLRPLYDASLWHQPITNDYREHYKARLPQGIRLVITQLLSKNRECDVSTAAQILDYYCNYTIADLVTWRCSQRDITFLMPLEHARVHRAAQQFVKLLPDEAQSTLLTRLERIQDAATAEGVFLPWYALVTDLPKSKERRRQQGRKLPTTLFNQIATRVEVGEPVAKSLVKNFMVYGTWGLMSIRDWQTYIHPVLWSYLYLFKLGRLEDMVDYPLLMETYNLYASLLGQHLLSQQVVTGICNHFPKPPYFNSGDGQATAGVPRRKSLKLAGVARLHEEWLVLPVPLEIDLLDPSLRSLNSDCTALCVFDGGTERVVTCCVYPGIVGETEIGLTLYDAIWHPHQLDFPLRGIPERVLIPPPLAKSDLSDIRAATKWLHATVDTKIDSKKYLDNHLYLKQTIAELQQLYVPAKLPNRRRAPRKQLTVQQAQTEIRNWLYQRGFTKDHRVEAVPKQLRLKNHALPGWNTIAAGYLLPIVAIDVPTTRNGVIYDSYLYSSSDVNIEPGANVAIRALRQSSQRPQAVFAHHGSGPLLLHLTLQERIA